MHRRGGKNRAVHEWKLSTRRGCITGLGQECMEMQMVRNRGNGRKYVRDKARVRRGVFKLGQFKRQKMLPMVGKKTVAGVINVREVPKAYQRPRPGKG